MPMGDGGIVQGAQGWTSHVADVITELAEKGIYVDEKPLPKNKEEFMEFAAAYSQEKGLPAPDFRETAQVDHAALADAHRSLAKKRGAIDDMQVARAIMHLLGPNFAKPEGEFKGHPPIEAWDAEKLTWLPWSGDDRLRIAVEAALERTFRQFTWIEKEKAGGGVRLVPAAQPRDPRFGSQPFLARISSACATLLRPMRALDDEDATGHLVRFECGRLLDLSPSVPFEEQVRMTRREDRVTRSTGKPFMEWEAPDEVRAEVRSICTAINEACKDKRFSLDIGPAEDVAAALLQAASAEAYKQLRDRLEAIKPHSPLLQLLHPSYNAWDPVVYELRQYTRGASGCPAFEEFLVFLGRRGSNRKGTTLKLLRAAFGSSSRPRLGRIPACHRILDSWILGFLDSWILGVLESWSLGVSDARREGVFFRCPGAV